MLRWPGISTTNKGHYGVALFQPYVAHSNQVGYQIQNLVLSLNIGALTGLFSSSRQTITRALEHGLFAYLKLERKVVICETLLAIGAGDPETVRPSMTIRLSLP